MKICISSPSYSIVVNGMVAKADNLRMLKGFCSVGDTSIPPIQFADDSLFMLDVDLEPLKVLR